MRVAKELELQSTRAPCQLPHRIRNVACFGGQCVRNNALVLVFLNKQQAEIYNQKEKTIKQQANKTSNQHDARVLHTTGSLYHGTNIILVNSSSMVYTACSAIELSTCEKGDNSMCSAIY